MRPAGHAGAPAPANAGGAAEPQRAATMRVMRRASPSHFDRRRVVLKGLVAAGIGTLTGAGAYGLLYERHRVEVTRVDVPVTGLHPELAGLRIALITDTHRSETVARSDIEQAVDLALAAQPDLVLLGGDYVTWGDRAYVRDAAESLGRLAAPHGVFAILGNHDDDRHVPAALARQGFTVLKDARTTLTINGHRLDIVGIRYWTRRPVEIAPLVDPAASTTILLAHDPRRLREASALGVPLVLSGHTHGGQVVLPWIGAPAARKFAVVAGLAHDAGTTIFVSRGVGTVYVPVRINCPPEVAVLTLRPGRTGV
jgi:predicted MPP superfamily phosphohydrolase